MSKDIQKRVEYHSLPPSMKYILYVLSHNGGCMYRTEIMKETGMGDRTVGYALLKLESLEFIERATMHPTRKKRVDKRLRYWRLKYDTS